MSMIHTDEDDEFERILRENKMKGQPYHWEAEAIKSAIRMEREEIAKMIEDAPTLMPFAQNDQGGCMMCGFTPKLAAKMIRARGLA
jgi:hypothetical protein